MSKRMLIDASHLEETRVVVASGNRLEEFDFESASKEHLKGNIYLAKVTRVEPSLQAAFIDFGGNRHGFLAFSEIHPDYYQIPVADRKALLAEQAEMAEAGESDSAEPDPAKGKPGAPDREMAGASDGAEGDGQTPPVDGENGAGAIGAGDPTEPGSAGDEGRGGGPAEPGYINGDEEGRAEDAKAGEYEVVGGDDEAEEEAERRRVRPSRHRYKIQEVIKRRQILLVQGVKEERGTKGAALTTYLSLAGRYCVLMPNTARRGGVSRKIINPPDRKRLKGILDEFDLPEGMAVILRTAAIKRSKAEIKRDFEYLLRLWDNVRERTLVSTAPTLVYEEANLIKRSIRDLYSKDIEEIFIEGEEGYRTAKEFMRMLIPSHAKNVKRYRDPAIPLFHRYQVEGQLDAMHNPEVRLKSGGYVVINPTEALVSIDVNSGRATKERNIEETAYKTNLEAADEIARQLRLRDLAGLIVIDFIDMAVAKYRHTVEKRLKDAMRADRARIQIGKISAFGLLELSRQRLRPSLFEASTKACFHCNGTGFVRSTESTALHVLRSIEEEGIRRRNAELTLSVPGNVALYILNQKRPMLTDIETRYNFRIMVLADDGLVAPDFRLERIKGRAEDAKQVQAIVPETGAEAILEEEAPGEETEETEETVEKADGEGAAKRRRRPRRRRAKRAGEEGAATAPDEQKPAPEGAAERAADGEDTAETETAPRKRKRRGKRGGRRRSRKTEATQSTAPAAETGTGAPTGAPTSHGAEAVEATGAAAAEQAPVKTSRPRGSAETAAKAPP
ncbi:MAG: Rne/Rng family ribonuclease, partial [Proteobacteria bacterium]|nr:Rne/Rng family ribonuclease [Pseudomonadota bacterium]